MKNTTRLINKMYKWNAIDLSEKQIVVGLKRLNLNLFEIQKVKTEKKETKWVATACLFHSKKSSVIVRQGKTKKQALAKIGLALPIKSWGIK